MYFKESWVECSKNCDVFLFLVVVLNLANSAESDDAAFYLDLHCLLMYLFRGFHFTKG